MCIVRLVGIAIAFLLLAAPSAHAFDSANTLFLYLPGGRVVIEMRPDLAPNHVARIKDLVRMGFYDKTPFHRVIADFMAQAGDPTGTATGGSGMKLRAEFSSEPFVRGVVAMARSEDADSADSQFFIMYARFPALDGKYTVWGKVLEGMDLVDRLAKGDGKMGIVAAPDRVERMVVAADELGGNEEAARLKADAVARERHRIAEEKAAADRKFKQQEEARLAAERARAASAAEHQRKIQASFSARKNLGDFVCLSGQKALGLVSVKISGFVERVEGRRIQIRITDSDGGTRYNGVDLHRDSIIWDDHDNWRSYGCR